jgi:hypothetical protein
MNTDTGQIKAYADLTKQEIDGGKWVPVSDYVADTVRIGQQERRRQRKAAKAARKRNRK